MSVIRLSLPLIPNTFGHIVVCVLSNIVWRILYVIVATSHQRCALYSICNSAPDTEAEYCDERVCVSVCACVCLSTVISTELHVQYSPKFVHGRGSVFLWRRSDTLCTSGSMHDVIFAHKPRLLNVAAQLKRCAHAALGLAIKCA